jgi:hypothetical protein
VKPLKK